MTDIKFLGELLNACGTSSDEGAPSAVLRNYIARVADTVRRDVMGNTVAVVNPNGKYSIMLSAHIDEIGLQVTAIEDNGLLRLRKIGGINTVNIIGHTIVVDTAQGLVPGVIVAKNTGENNTVPDIDSCFADIFCGNSDEAAEKVRIGDYVTFSPNFRLVSDTLVSKSIDDRSGVFVISQVMRNLKDRLRNVRLVLAASVQEEIGLRGMAIIATSENPDICINVDVTDARQFDKKHLPAMGDGCVLYRNADTNPLLFVELERIAGSNKIPYSIGVSRNITGGTDASRIQLFAKGASVADISIPCKHMHTHNEQCSLRDVNSCIDLIEAFILSVDKTLECGSPSYII